ncbi:DUF956 family protein, partial [Enterococcus faecium]|nr:DUF956 family protein [Enterococcus faecium]
IRKHVDADRMVRSLGVWDVIKRGVMSIFKRKAK